MGGFVGTHGARGVRGRGDADGHLFSVVPPSLSPFWGEGGGGVTLTAPPSFLSKRGRTAGGVRGRGGRVFFQDAQAADMGLLFFPSPCLYNVVVCSGATTRGCGGRKGRRYNCGSGFLGWRRSGWPSLSPFLGGGCENFSWMDFSSTRGDRTYHSHPVPTHGIGRQQQAHAAGGF